MATVEAFVVRHRGDVKAVARHYIHALGIRAQLTKDFRAWPEDITIRHQQGIHPGWGLRFREPGEQLEREPARTVLVPIHPNWRYRAPEVYQAVVEMIARDA